MSQPEETEITLIEVLKHIRGYWNDFKKNKIIFIFFIAVCCFAGFVVSYFSKPKFIASCTMMLESSKNGGGSGGALALASQFGLIGGGGGSTISEDKLLEVVKTENVIRTALFQKAKIDSTTDIMANHIINLFGYKKAWTDNDSLKNFRFEHSLDNLTVKENGILKLFVNRVLGEFLKVEKSKSEIINITVITPSEEFSYHLNNFLVSSISNFYIDHITEKESSNVSIIQKRVDSIAEALADAEYSYARWKDGSNQLVKAQGLINEIRLRRNVEVLNSMYIEGVKQLEIAKFTLVDQTPFLQIIDKPSFPLATKEKTKLSISLALGFFAGLFFFVLYLFLKRNFWVQIKDFINSPN